MVLRVQQMRALWPRTASTSVAVAVATPLKMAEEVQRHPLGRQHAARRAVDDGDAVTRFDAAAVAAARP